MTTVLTPLTRVDEARSQYFGGDHDAALCSSEALITSLDPAEKVGGLLLKACILSERNQYAESLETLKMAGPLIDNAPAKSRAAFHGQRAYIRGKMGRKDKALLDYEAARFWAQESGDELAEATVRNNLARIYGELGRFEDAITESDRAIHTVRKLNERVYLGRCYDQRAQILIRHGDCSEAVKWSEKALSVLGSHPSSLEARLTLGRALIGVGATYLDHPDRVENFRARREAVNSINLPLDPETIQLALDRCEGNILRAANLLHVKHQSLQGSVNRFNLKTHQARHVRRSLIKK